MYMVKPDFEAQKFILSTEQSSLLGFSAFSPKHKEQKSNYENMNSL